MAFPNGWRMRAAIGIHHARVGADVTNFPMLFKWDGTVADSNLPSNMFSGNIIAQSTGADVRLTTDSVGMSLFPLEVVQFSTSGIGNAQIWGKVPVISSVSDTTIYAWWGNPTATALTNTDTNGRNAVWSDYSSVFHLESGSFTNSAGNANGDGTNVGTTDTTAGEFGGAKHFDGTAAAITTSAYNINAGTWQAYAWTDTTAQVQYAKVVLKDFTTNSAPYTSWDICGDGSASLGPQSWKAEIAINGVQFGAVSSVFPVANQWYSLVARHDHTNLTIWTDGTNRHSTAASGNIEATTEPIQIGRAYYNNTAVGQWFHGKIDEVRVSGQIRSNGWILTEYNLFSSPASFSSYINSQYCGPVSINIW
jgi:Concanavalin A-like lectin/glucanases superfamily